MGLKVYFEKTDGIGILSTADAEGNVDAAVYARPHVQSDSIIAFIMQPRLSYANLQTNPKAVYLFLEKAPGCQGRRLYLEKINEETDPAKVQAARRSTHGSSEADERARFVFFRVTHIRPLTGDIEEE